MCEVTGVSKVHGVSEGARVSDQLISLQTHQGAGVCEAAGASEVAEVAWVVGRACNQSDWSPDSRILRSQGANVCRCVALPCRNCTR